MERVFDTGLRDDKGVNFFIGKEVEHTPAFGMQTLFVVGIQPVSDIIAFARQEECTHIYFGANMSFDVKSVNDYDGWQAWEKMIKAVLDHKEGFWATLDIPHDLVLGLHDGGLCEHNRFIPMISVKMPYIGLFNYNATIKIDDKDFDSTNPGVWCWSLHDLKDRNKFTDWSKYTKDKVIL